MGLIHSARRSSNSTMRAVTELPLIISSPTEIGNLKRRGPALPGLTYSTPDWSRIDG